MVLGKLEINVMGHQSMVQTGSSLLKLIQNSTLPRVDLLVRESIQNSLDAGIPGKSEVNVDFLTGSCSNARLSSVFTGITQALRDKFSAEMVDYIAVRDSNTTGLTGPLRESELHDTSNLGNLRKLIYEICRPQMEEGKGGSWGLGKTVYFRCGIGLVLYYSRIKMDSGYQSRMAAALIEDEARKESLLRKAGQKKGNLFCGVAWWGQNDGPDNSMPVIDDRQIQQVLDILGIAPYTGDETGTTIVIPYIDRKQLEHNANARKSIVLKNYNLEEFLDIAVQRWYAPRLYNKQYKYGSSLRYSRNGRVLRRAEREDFFNLIQNLYNEAPTQGVCISVRNELENSGVAGHIYWQRVTRQDLGILPPYNKLSPYVLLGCSEDKEDISEGNPPIICYCRKAGMIINYETDSSWTSGISKTPSDEFLVGFFVLNSENAMKNRPEVSLDEYIRKGEKADHLSWHDWEMKGHAYQVVEKISKQVARKIANAEKPAATPKEKHNDAVLQRKMGKAFLPPMGFGRLASKTSKTPPKREPGPVPQSKAPSMEHPDIQYTAFDVCQITWTARMRKPQPELVHEISAVAGSSVIHARDWENDKKGIGTKFPFEIISARGTANNISLNCTLIETVKGANFAFAMDTSELTMPKGKKAIKIDCSIEVCCKDHTLSSTLSVREDEV